MTSKERVKAAIARQPVDKVPLGFYAVDYDTVEKVLGYPTYVRNKVAIQVALWEGRRDEVSEDRLRGHHPAKGSPSPAPCELRAGSPEADWRSHLGGSRWPDLQGQPRGE